MSKKPPAKKHGKPRPARTKSRAPSDPGSQKTAASAPPSPRKFNVHGSFGENGYLVHGTMSGGDEPAVDVEIEGSDLPPRDGEKLASAFARVSIGAGTAKPLRVSVELEGKIAPIFEFLGAHGPSVLSGILGQAAALAPAPAPSDLRAFLSSLHPAQFELLMGALTDAQKELLAAKGIIDTSTTPMPRASTQSSRAPAHPDSSGPAPGSDASAKG